MQTASAPPRYAAAGLLRNSVPIEVIEAPSPAAFRRHFVERSRPAILRGLSDGWPARRWTLASFRARYGDRVVQVVRTSGGMGIYDADSGVQYDLSRPLSVQARSLSIDHST